MNEVNELAEQKVHVGGLTESDVDVCFSFFPFPFHLFISLIF